MAAALHRLRRRVRAQFRPAPLGVVALVIAAVVVVLTGVLPSEDTDAVLGRVWPVLAFLALLTLLADLCDDAGLFDFAAAHIAHAARGRTHLLFLLFCLLAVLTTWFLSLDTTAVLLTPVAIAIARRVRVPVLPFALACLWLANTASLLLPVSNLTNLLAEHTLPPGRSYVALSLWPQLAIVVVTLVVLVIVQRRAGGGSYVAERPPPPRDPIALAVAAAASVGVGITASLGVAAWISALVAVAVLWTVLAARSVARPAVQMIRRLPVAMIVATTALFVIIAGIAHVLAPTLAHLTVTSTGTGSLLALSATSAAGANLVNNLPAYLAFEPLAGTPEALMAVLIGVNAGPIVLLWGSLANLLWYRTCRREGLAISLPKLSALGLVVATGSLLAGVTVLSLIAA